MKGIVSMAELSDQRRREVLTIEDARAEGTSGDELLMLVLAGYTPLGVSPDYAKRAALFVMDG
jgi:hypothetical protein